MKEQDAWSTELAEIRAQEVAGSAIGALPGSVPIEVSLREDENEEGGVSSIVPPPSVAWDPRSALQVSRERVEDVQRPP